MRIHFSGIGGIGISALAQLCLSRGDVVSGSEKVRSEVFPVLERLGIPVIMQQRTDNITEDLDLLVYSEAVPETNPERKAAKKRGIRQASYFEYLGEVSKQFRTIAFAGTHGKTSSLALFATASQKGKFDPTVVIGTQLQEFENSNFHRGTNDWFAVEACEYRRNFRFLEPEIVVLTSVEHDHFDAFPTEESYFSAFENLVEKADIVIFHADDGNARRVLENFLGKKVPVSREEVPKMDLKVPGEFNQKNAALAWAVARELNLDLKKFQAGLEMFKGSGRRQEVLGEHEGVKIYDDYAHHPTEIRALIDGIREREKHGKLGIIFEPHQHSRTAALLPEFLSALRTADVIGLFPIYTARDSAEDKKRMPNAKLRAALPEAMPVENWEDVDQFWKQFSSGDTVIFCGAGNISQFARDWLHPKK
ncbi:MAG: hypothetical protein K9M51_00605 [Candidatus Gracilibacteria bacterium]|nr:hypothetical protein [Candidatus Gracilibacteria bacterium]